MPWKIKEDNGRYCVHKENDDGSLGERLKCYSSRSDAESYQRALYANVKAAFREKLNLLEHAFRLEYPYQEPTPMPVSADDAPPYFIDADEKYIIVEDKMKYYKIPYSMNGGKITFAQRGEWIETSQEIVWKSIELVAFGNEVKALDGGKVAGYLVTFGGLDLTGDYFTKETDFGEAEKLPVLYQHGFDNVIKRRRIGTAEIVKDDVGLWAEAQLNMRDDYERRIYELAKAGKLGWSSGSASHVVEREQTGEAAKISQWFIAEASLTPTPAEPRNVVMSIKSLYPPADCDCDKIKKEFDMEENELTALLEKTAATAAEQAVKKYAESLPDIKAGYMTQVKDEADRALEGNPFKSYGEFLQAVATGTTRPQAIDQRLLPLKATGLNEAIPSQGGFLVPPTYAAGIWDKMYNTGELLRRMAPAPISGNSVVRNIVDETSRANGSRFGGITGYWLNEGGTKQSSKPAFRQSETKLWKVAALSYASDELLQDAAALENVLMRDTALELTFMTEHAFYRGDGVGKPLGMITSPAFISVTRLNANQINAADIVGMWARRYVGANDYVWAINPSATAQLHLMTIGNMPVYLPPSGLTGGLYGTILGRPVVEVEYAPALGTAGDILLFSPSNYEAITKAGGIQTDISIHVQFVTDETCFRSVLRVGGQPLWNNTLTGFDGTTYSPFVGLLATS